jgi:hypothetical protein
MHEFSMTAYRRDPPKVWGAAWDKVFDAIDEYVDEVVSDEVRLSLEREP